LQLQRSSLIKTVAKNW